MLYRYLILGLGLLLLPTAWANPSTQHAYTSVKTDDCVTIESSANLAEPEVDYYHGECPALGGYQVFITGGDLRYSLELHYAGQEVAPYRIYEFHDLGAKAIEWRYQIQAREAAMDHVKYQALIYRLRYEHPESNKDRDQLVVVRLAGAKSCVLGVLEQQTKMNEKARQLADDPNAQCMPTKPSA